tara:strand:- start:49110 stop:49643 length:534 start_codon:yes stop_codon:yes gene_type:complete
MLKTATSLITAACIFVHAVLGCCVHHVHGGEDCDIHAEVSHDGEHHEVDRAEGDCGAGHSQVTVAVRLGSANASDFSREKAAHETSTPQLTVGCTHHGDSDHPESPCEESPCQWTSAAAELSMPCDIEMYCVSVLDCCDLTAVVAACKRVQIGRHRIAPDRLSSSLRVHALDQVWQL